MSVPLAEKDRTSRNESVVDRGVHDMLPGPLFHIIILDKWKVSCIQRNVSQGALSCLSGTETPRTITICVWSLILWDRALLKIQYSHVNTPSVSSSGSPPSKTAYLARGFGFQEPHLISHFFICMFCNFFLECVKIINGIKITTAILYDVLMNQVFNIYFLILSFRDSLMVITVVSLYRKQTKVGRDYKLVQQFSPPYCLCGCNFFSLPFWNKTASLYCNRTVLTVSFCFQSQEYGFSLNAMTVHLSTHWLYLRTIHHLIYCWSIFINFHVFFFKHIKAIILFF